MRKLSIGVGSRIKVCYQRLKKQRKLSVDEAVEIATIFGVSVNFLIGLTDRTLTEEN
jgi:antitoxin component HigA of HigAB toxin-antitoxin module